MNICDYWKLGDVSDEFFLFDDNGEEFRDV